MTKLPDYKITNSFLPFPRLDKFSDFSFHQVALQRADVADIELSVQVIGFMKKSACQQLFPCLLKPLAVHILSTHSDFLWPRHRLAKVWNAKAPFTLALLTLGVDDLGIHQH